METKTKEPAKAGATKIAGKGTQPRPTIPIDEKNAEEKKRVTAAIQAAKPPTIEEAIVKQQKLAKLIKSSNVLKEHLEKVKHIKNRIFTEEVVVFNIQTDSLEYPIVNQSLVEEITDFLTIKMQQKLVETQAEILKAY